MLALILTVVIVVADQVSKYAVSRSLYMGQQIPVIPGFFTLTYHCNDGAAWGMLGGHNGLLIGFSAVVLVLLVLFRRAMFLPIRTHCVTMGLLVGGVVGNLLDRLRLGSVVDFLDFHVGPYHWPAFNVADSALCIGVGIYIVSFFLLQRGAAGCAAGEAASD